MELFNLAKEVPQWMDREFFEKVIKKVENDSMAIVEKLNVGPGAKIGENFGSAIFRAVITYNTTLAEESKTISVIIKVKATEYPPEYADTLEFFQDSVQFRTEMEVYGKILPAIHSLLREAHDDDVLSPKLIYQSDDPVNLIILEDVSVSGFDEIIKKPPTDFEMSKKIARRLAKFHAGSFYLQSEKKYDFTHLTNHLLRSGSMTDAIFTQGLEGFIAAAKNWKGFEMFVPHLEDFEKQLVGKPLLGETIDDGYNVLNHADFHRNNLLFKMNAEGKLIDFSIFDFQIVLYASPAIDLFYALCFFVSPENRQKHRDEFIEIYHQQFVESLEKFGCSCSPPSLSDLHSELSRNGHLEVLMFICFGLWFHGDYTQYTSDDKTLTPVQQRTLMYQMPGFKEIILQELPVWLEKGFIGK